MRLECLANLAGVVIHTDSSQGPAIDLPLFEGRDPRGKAVLVRTDWDHHWRTEQYFEGHSYLTKAAVEFLVKRVQCWSASIGINSPKDQRGDDRCYYEHADEHPTLLPGPGAGRQKQEHGHEQGRQYQEQEQAADVEILRRLLIGSHGPPVPAASTGSPYDGERCLRPAVTELQVLQVRDNLEPRRLKASKTQPWVKAQWSSCFVTCLGSCDPGCRSLKQMSNRLPSGMRTVAGPSTCRRRSLSEKTWNRPDSIPLSNRSGQPFRSRASLTRYVTGRLRPSAFFLALVIASSRKSMLVARQPRQAKSRE